jgi:FkbM family methyltransferase
MYESAEIRLVERELRPDRPVVELGSSLGVLASHITSRLGPNTIYVGVEADPALVASARKNLLRHARCRWTLLHAAVVPEGSEDTAHFAAGESSLTGIVRPKSIAQIDSVIVPTTTLREIRARFALPQWVLVMDVEGMEHEILDSSSLDGCIQIIAEFHNRGGRSVQDLVSDLVTLGFVIDQVDGNIYALSRPQSDHPTDR